MNFFSKLVNGLGFNKSDDTNSEPDNGTQSIQNPDENYAYASSVRGQGYMLYKGRAIEKILELTGLAGAYIWKPRTR